MELDFVDVRKAHFFTYGLNAGASPDGLVGTDELLEIKCPQPKKFFRYLVNGLSEVDSMYYDQMQMQMLCAKVKGCYFVNYVQYNGKEYMHPLYIARNEETIDLIIERINEAVILRDEYVIKLNKAIEKLMDKEE